MRHLESLVVSKGEGVVEAGAGVAEDTEQSLTTKNSSLHGVCELKCSCLASSCDRPH